MNNGRRGASFERQVKVDLEIHGWFVVRAAGSHGHADLLAVSAGEVAFVQAKLGGPGAFPPAEWAELFDVAMRYGGVPIVVHRPRRGRLEYLRMLAHKTGIKGVRPPVEPWSPVP